MLGTLVLVAVGGVLVVAAVGAFLYATDYAMQADVKDTDCKGAAADALNVVAVRTRIFAIDHAVRGVPDQQCNLLESGDRVVYHLRSKHTILYRNGEVCYDSEKGPGLSCLAASSPGLLS